MNIYNYFPIPKNEMQFLFPMKDFLKNMRGIIATSVLNMSVPVYVVRDSEFIKTENTLQVFDYRLFNNAMQREFFNRLIIFTNVENDADLAARDIGSKFLEYLEDYKIRKSDNWGRIIGARAANFSPIANFDKYSDGTLKYEGSEVNASEYNGKEKDTRTESGTEKETANHGAQNRTQNSSNTTYNDSNFYDVNKIVEADNAYIDINSRTFEDRKTEGLKEFINRVDENTKSFINRKDTNTLHEYGNIGVQTTISIIKEYLDFYRNDIVMEILTDFIDEISIY